MEAINRPPETPLAKETQERLAQAVALHRRGELDAALPLYRKILEDYPDQPDALQLAGLIHKRKGEWRLAVELMQRSLQINPDQPHVWANFAAAHAEAEQFDAAYEAYKQALLRDPGNPRLHLGIGVMSRHLCLLRDAEAAFEIALRLNPRYTDAWRQLGILYKQQGRSADMLHAYEMACDQNPTDPVLHVNLGNAFKSLGKLPEAQAAYQEAIRLKPDLMEAHRQLALVRSYASSADAHIGQMEALIRTPDLPDSERVQLCFALAKAYHDAGVIVKSWNHLKEGNRLKRKEYDYDQTATHRWFDRVIAAYPKEAVQRQQGESLLEDAPIFILGMPRSGTSLVEQILASHPQVHGAGELEELRMLVQRHWPRWHGAQYPEGAEQLGAHHKLQLAGEYQRRMNTYLPEGKSRLIDKMPGNFRFAGLIHQILPNAKIIHCKRDPMDTCVSIYRHYFSGCHPYAYDLRELGMYYRDYERLMRHWRRVLPEGVMLDIGYEELVADPQFHTRRLLDFCNLSWDDACLAFHRTERPVHTPSALQVRQPIHARAIGAWRGEADYLQPLLDALKV